MEELKNHSMLNIAFGLEDGEELDLVDGAELDLSEDQDLENREMISEIAATEDYYSHYNPYANAIHNATQLFLTSHKSFESFVSALGNEDFMQPFKGSNSYDMIVASAIDNVGNMMRYYPISVEDYSLNDLVANIALEEYAISFEGAAGAATTGIISRLANLGAGGWSRIKSWGEAIAAGYKALKAAIAKKDWGAVRAIKGFITRAKRYAKDPKKMFPRLIPGNKAKKIAAVNEKRYIKNMPKRVKRNVNESKRVRNYVNNKNARTESNLKRLDDFENDNIELVRHNKSVSNLKLDGDHRPLYKRIVKNLHKNDYKRNKLEPGAHIHSKALRLTEKEYPKGKLNIKY